MERQGHILSSFQRKQLENQLQQTDLSKLLSQRIKIMLLADEGKTQKDICQELGCSAPTASRWIMFARAQIAHQWKESPPGRPKKVSDQYIQRLKKLVEVDPRDCGYPFQRWTAHWLNTQLVKEFGIQLSDRHLSRLLKELELSTASQFKTTESGTHQINTESKVAIRNLKITSKTETSDITSLNFIPLKHRFRQI
jgi:transposase